MYPEVGNRSRYLYLYLEKLTIMRLWDILLVYFLHAGNKAKIGDQEYQGSVIGACPLHLYKSAYKLGNWQKTKCTVWFHIYWKQWKTGSYTEPFVDNEGATDSISCYITKTAKWYGLGDTIPMDWLHAGWQKYYSHIHRRNNGGVCHQVLYTEGHF